MSTQAAVLERTGSAAVGDERRSVFTGAWLVSVATLAAGVLTYAYHVLAARTLGPHAYGQIAILWGAIFLAAIVLFRPLEQTLSRTIADRRARGEEVRTVLRPIGLICAGILVLGGIAFAAAWGQITERVFLGNDLMTAMLVAGIAAYGLQYLVRGLVGGARWFGGYGLSLCADGVARLLVAVPLVFAASQDLAALALVAAGLGGALIPVLAGRRILASLLVRGTGGRFELGSALGFAAPTCVIAAADQLLTNGAPLLVIVGNGTDGTKSAGIVMAATMLVRAPVYVFQGLAASFLPNLTLLHATDDPAGFRRAVTRTVLYLLGAGLVIVGLTAIAGEQAMALYGSGFEAGRQPLVLLALGVAFYLGAATFSQGLLAADCAVRAAAAWLVSALLLVVLYATIPGSELYRVSVAFAVATLVGLVLLGGALYAKVRHA
jgi:O-antigen/teichoic acid export membrane protein